MTDAASSVRVVAAVVARDGRYLVCRRPDHKRHGGLWEFPGGKVHDGETRADAIRRELSEELELAATEVGELLFTSGDEGSAFVIEFVETRALGDPVLHEHSDAEWFRPDELRELPLAPADARFVAWVSEKRRPS